MCKARMTPGAPPIPMDTVTEFLERCCELGFLTRTSGDRVFGPQYFPTDLLIKTLGVFETSDTSTTEADMAQGHFNADAKTRDELMASRSTKLLEIDIKAAFGRTLTRDEQAIFKAY